ncbi:MAG: UDP-N-acetylmuramoyl-L-alanine--D-glutamate ligase [Porticoccaceae bacterium]|nr:UDP-N-acetylmuramoyl-L-alanine--D-glutamate ligase [Porticoccaceae bacterium]
MHRENLKNRRIAIFGMGATGLSVARFLASSDISFVFVDSRDKPASLAKVRLSYPSVEIFLGSFNSAVLSNIDLIILSPGISLKESILQEAQALGIEIVGDLALFLSAVEAPVVLITGSNGKSTVTSLVGDMALHSELNAGVGGNLGVPMLDLLDKGRELYVLELSSFQLELMIPSQGAIACLLNVSPDHMDRHETIANYTSIKHKVFSGASVSVTNRQDGLTALTPRHINQQVIKQITFGLDEPRDDHFGLKRANGDDYLCCGSEFLIKSDDIAMKGRHNMANALAALAIGTALDLPLSAMIKVLGIYTGLAHRCQAVATIGDILFIDDSKGTNVGATVAAIESFGAENSKNVVLIAGGQGKGQNFSDLSDVANRFVKHGILFGEDAMLIEKSLNPWTHTSHVDSLLAAVDLAKQQAVAGDIVLFSPACASFDLFSGFEERGRCFQQAVLTSVSGGGALC